MIEIYCCSFVLAQPQEGSLTAAKFELGFSDFLMKI